MDCLSGKVIFVSSWNFNLEIRVAWSIYIRQRHLNMNCAQAFATQGCQQTCLPYLHKLFMIYYVGTGNLVEVGLPYNYRLFILSLYSNSASIIAIFNEVVQNKLTHHRKWFWVSLNFNYTVNYVVIALFSLTLCDIIFL